MKRFPRLRKFFLRSSIVLAVGIAGYWVFENWRGEREWSEAEGRVKAAGISLSRADYGGPEISGDEDLLMDPVFLAELDAEDSDKLGLWRNLFADRDLGRNAYVRPHEGRAFNYRDCFGGEMTEKEARDALAKAAEEHESRIADLSKAILGKPDYDFFARSEVEGGVFDVSSRVIGVRGLYDGFRSSGLMAIRQGNSELALERVRALDRLGRICDGPSIINFLIGRAFLFGEIELIWEGLRLEVWSRDEIAEFSTFLKERDLKTPFVTAIKHELAWGLEVFDSLDGIEEFLDEQGGGVFGGGASFMAYGGPAGWTGRRKALMGNAYLDLIASVESGGTSDDRAEIDERLPQNMFSPLYMVGSTTGMIIRSADQYESAETIRRLALIGLALEDWRLSKEAYPESLAMLALDIPLTDLTDPARRDLAYELGPKGRPQIWSLYEAEEIKEKRQKLRWQFWAKEK